MPTKHWRTPGLRLLDRLVEARIYGPKWVRDKICHRNPYPYIPQTFTRRGNYFLRMRFDWYGAQQMKWLLIAGPWFKYLEIMHERNGGYQQKFAYIPFDTMTLEPNTGQYPVYVESRDMMWARTTWGPGSSISWRGVGNLFGSMLEYRWRTFLGGRNKPGWYVLGDLKNEEHTGNIPAYLHYFNFIQDDYEHDMYISMGY